jgi:hypothetical protein
MWKMAAYHWSTRERFAHGNAARGFLSVEETEESMEK